MEDNQAIIEQMVADAKSAPEPGTLKAGQVLHSGDESAPAPQVATRMKTAGYSFIWDTVTGERSVTNNNMLRQQLEKRREDGTRVFSTVDPHIPLKRGNLKCMLHPDMPDREHYDMLGLATCKKDNLTSPYQVTRHMTKRHKVEWETIEKERADREKAEERAFQRSLVGMARTGVVDTTYQPQKPQETAVEADLGETTAVAVKVKGKRDCPYCGKSGIDGRHINCCPDKP